MLLVVYNIKILVLFLHFVLAKARYCRGHRVTSSNSWLLKFSHMFLHYLWLALGDEMASRPTKQLYQTSDCYMTRRCLP